MRGVLLENGQRIAAPVVIANADVTQVIGELVGVEHLPARYVHRVRRMVPSLSALVAYLATDLDLRALDLSHEMHVYEGWDHDATYRSILRGELAAFGLSVPTLTDPSLAPAGEHLVIVTTLIPYDLGASWRAEKARYTELLTGKLEGVIPGLGEHLTFAEGASLRTMERYTLNLTGTIYGWELSPKQTGRHRLARQTPIRGLWLSGQWTQPGGGIDGVAASGLQTARAVLGQGSLVDFVRSLRSQAAALATVPAGPD